MLKIIFVCHGNICRSPMAEFIMNDLVRKSGLSGKVSISSAAVSCEEEGMPIYPPAARILQMHGIPSDGHHAHKISGQEGAEADMIIIMDHSNERLLKRIIHPEDFGKIHYMMEFAGKPGQDVADPWYTGDFGRTFDDLYSACSGLVSLIRQGD